MPTTTYWNASALAGFVVDKNTDAQLQYTAYRTNNYLPVLAATTMPFGAGAQEYTVTLGLKHKFNTTCSVPPGRLLQQQE